MHFYKGTKIKLYYIRPISSSQMHVSEYLQLAMTKTKKGLMRIWRLKLANHIHICVVSDTPLKKIVQASVVAISNYNLYRRDRNWFDNDKREKGGVTI